MLDRAATGFRRFRNRSMASPTAHSSLRYSIYQPIIYSSLLFVWSRYNDARGKISRRVHLSTRKSNNTFYVASRVSRSILPSNTIYSFLSRRLFDRIRDRYVNRSMESWTRRYRNSRMVGKKWREKRNGGRSGERTLAEDELRPVI